MQHDSVRSILETVLCLKAEDDLLIITDTVKEPIARTFGAAAEEVGATVGYHVVSEEERPLLSLPSSLGAKLTKRDAYINVFDARKEETPFRIQLIRAQVATGARTGHAPGITEDMMTEGAVTADYTTMLSNVERLMPLLHDAASARITTAKGTDITVAIAGRAFETDVIITAGGVGNLPAGEVFCAPIEDEGDGVMVVDGAIGDVPLGDREITLVVEGGAVVETRAADAELKATVDALLDTDANARVIGELGIGLNEKARLSDNMLEAEKAGGTVHIAFGNNIDMPGGRNDSKTHRDYLMRAVTVTITYTDGSEKTIIRDGELTFG